MERLKAEGQSAKARELQSAVNECLLQQEAAAQKIQAIQRGRAARRDAELLKSGKSNIRQSVESKSPGQQQAEQDAASSTGTPAATAEMNPQQTKSQSVSRASPGDPKASWSSTTSTASSQRGSLTSCAGTVAKAKAARQARGPFSSSTAPPEIVPQLSTESRQSRQSSSAYLEGSSRLSRGSNGGARASCLQDPTSPASPAARFEASPAVSPSAGAKAKSPPLPREPISPHSPSRSMPMF